MVPFVKSHSCFWSSLSPISNSYHSIFALFSSTLLYFKPTLSDELASNFLENMVPSGMTFSYSFFLFQHNIYKYMFTSHYLFSSSLGGLGVYILTEANYFTRIPVMISKHHSRILLYQLFFIFPLSPLLVCSSHTTRMLKIFTGIKTVMAENCT